MDLTTVVTIVTKTIVFLVTNFSNIVLAKNFFKPRINFILKERIKRVTSKICVVDFSKSFVDPPNVSKWGSEAQNYYFPVSEDYTNLPSGFFIAFCASVGKILVNISFVSYK